jgi:hypothetical protein
MQFCNKRKLKPDPELILYKFTPIQIDVKNELKWTFSTREGETNKKNNIDDFFTSSLRNETWAIKKEKENNIQTHRR